MKAALGIQTPRASFNSPVATDRSRIRVPRGLIAFSMHADVNRCRGRRRSIYINFACVPVVDRRNSFRAAGSGQNIIIRRRRVTTLLTIPSYNQFYHFYLPPISSSLNDEDHLTNKRKYLADDRSDSGKDLKKAKLETKALKAKRPGFTDERYNETSYYIENGLRKVYPYYFTFTTFTKGRWVNQNILDVFAREFRAHPAEEYERCIKTGSLTVNYQKVDTEYKLKHNDLLANVVHRHEVPVTNEPITIVHMDDDIVVVNKPASIPVHPCGRYRHNTVVFVLAKEHNLRNLRTIHRLDRLTSGLLMFGRTPRYARIMEAQIRNRQVNKQYVCRVEGKFPEQTIECNQPIEVVSYKIGVCKVSNKGKSCSTTFQLVGYNEKTNISVVLCFPHSGRMHQIRVHLQYLGYPVKNDPLYNHVVFGPDKGRGGIIGKSDEQLIHDLINIHNAENWLGMDGDSDLMPIMKDVDVVDDGKKTPPGMKKVEPLIVEQRPQPQTKASQTVRPSYDHALNASTQTGQDGPDTDFDEEKLTQDLHCYECRVKFRDPKPKDLIMFLHAWKYSGPGWSYETELPVWANVDWMEPE
ncbi:Pseudouridine synthase, catalytic domain,Pseudouridine synthase, RluC/RluD, conserved [Cinara cedri]|uniref:Pseudouridylate synthase RPUSD2 n=1 Tax=Cinara cedri TaxID=506608 RepID=A0A5E4N070_9HEMI|nr:Pseudouridine synthase, catalytic domain,Pseudouridine synthase, RluC/RluD, conserved [Cinara cedri]